jgi:hypothetical protein
MLKVYLYDRGVLCVKVFHLKIKTALLEGGLFGLTMRV